MDANIKVLAIDTGFDRLGIAILDKINNRDNLIYSECFETKRKDKIQQRLLEINNYLEGIIQKYNPNTVVCESLFVFKNHKTVISVAGVRGIILYLCGKYNIEFVEYTPIQIKSAVTGDGRADKKQVEFMVRNIFKSNLFKDKILDDEMDAIAIGITGLAYFKNLWYI